MADRSIPFSTGGQYTCGVVLNTVSNSLANSSASVNSLGPGRLDKFVLLSNAINSLTIYDNSVGPGGLILFNTPINTASPVIYDLQLPFNNGLWISGVGNGPSFSFSFGLAGPGAT